MTKSTFSHQTALRAVAYSILTLIVLYGTPWLLWGEIGYEAASFHPMLIVCAVAAAYHGVLSGLTVLALLIAPYAAFDVPSRAVDEMLHLYSLRVLFWPALSAIAVAIFGSVRDLREGELSTARDTIDRLRSDLTMVQKAADAALVALKRNEAEIATRRDMTPLVVIKALKRLGKCEPTSFTADLERVFWLIAPSADFVLFSSDAEPIAAASNIRSSMIDQMRRCISSATVEGAVLKPAAMYGFDPEAMAIVAYRANCKPAFVFCVACRNDMEADEILQYLPEVSEAIGKTANSIKPKRRSRPPNQAMA